MMTKAVLPIMRKQRSGRIISIGSLAGLIGVPFQSYYAASKHALEGFFKSLRFEVAPFQIYVSIIEPGFFKTNLELANESVISCISDYDRGRTNALHVFSESINKGATPEPIARLVLNTLRSRRPRLSYRIGTEAIFLPILQFLSYPFYEWGARRQFKV